MKTSENVQSLIGNYFRYLSSSTESEKDAASALESITVVRRSDDRKYKMIGITSAQSGERIFMFKSHSPFMKEHEGIAGCSIEHDYCEINEDEFDEKFYTYDAWQHGLLNLIIAEMNKEIFKFLHPYFITANQDWTFELSCKGTRMSLKFWGYGASHRELVIHIEKINKAHITLYGDDGREDIVIFDYNDTATTMDPVPYGALTEEDMVKLCNKVEEVMRSSDDVIRGRRLSDGWENEEFDNARKISNFNETLDGTFDGLINYHEAVAGRGVKRYEHKENDKR